MVEIDENKLNNLVKEAQELFPNVNQFFIWVYAYDHLLKEAKGEEAQFDREEAFEAYKRCKEEFKNEKYENINIV